MSYDLMILSVGVKHKDNIFQSSIIAERLNGFGISNNERYPFAGKIKGTWFELKNMIHCLFLAPSIYATLILT